MIVKDTKKEYILCAAIHYDDGKSYTEQPLNIKTGIIVTGRRHNNAFMTLKQLKSDFDPKLINPMMGFITSHNRYVERPEAFDIALSQQQIMKNEYLDFPLFFNDDEDFVHCDILISEDLYGGFD